MNIKNNKFLVSVIMPVYNVYNYLEKSILSLIKQTLNFKNNIELILIDDGSTDNSDKICKKYLKLYPNNIKYVCQKNQGSNIARNAGIKLASGKYICFLDSDDTLNKVALEKLTVFFDKHYDEVDLVEYKIIPINNGIRSKSLHYKYDFLKETGVYDLTMDKNIYCSVTTINYMVKNLGEKTCLFDVNLKAHEDQKYSMDVIRSKMKIGYVNEAEYLYLQRANSITKSYFYAYYLFDATVKFWEDLFISFNGMVPRYFQALFLNDVIWKNKKDILKPYQYEGKKYNREYGRIIKLINLCDDYVILNHPLLDIYYKLYYLSLKKSSIVTYNINKNKNAVEILNNNNIIYEVFDIEVHFLTMKNTRNSLKIKAYLKSPIFELIDKPILYLVTNNIRDNIKLINSSFDYLDGKEKVNKTYLFDVNINVKDLTNFTFKLKINNLMLGTKLFFENKTIFNDNLKRYEYCYLGYNYRTDGESIYIKKINKIRTIIFNVNVDLKYLIIDWKKWAFRLIFKLFHIKDKIWLYYDCNGVEKDNCYFQFVYDLEINDGIKRFFVTTHNKRNIKKIFNKKQQKHLIRFNSFKHKIYSISADKIITSYIEQNNCSVFSKTTFLNYIDISKNPEIVYLQHGVLHAHMPWKYSLDRLLVDKIVISTAFERNNLIKNYSYVRNNLIESGMSRFDYINLNKKAKNVILFAPSWRNYLIGKQGNNWVGRDELFLESSFYKETQKFLNSKELEILLKKYNYILDFKLHPIFKRYEHHYNINSDNVILDTGNYSSDDYKVFITDYSSYVFDFVYLKRAIIYFFPDYDLFKAGLNDYRELDLPLEKGFGELCLTSKQLLDRLEFILKNNGIDEKKYIERSNNFFLYYDNNQCKRIYNDISKSA